MINVCMQHAQVTGLQQLHAPKARSLPFKATDRYRCSPPNAGYQAQGKGQQTAAKAATCSAEVLLIGMQEEMASLRLKEAEAAAAHAAAALQLQGAHQAARHAESLAQDLEARVTSLQVRLPNTAFQTLNPACC